MNLKTFQARSMPEALQRVKRELGRDAVILHTRTVRRGGWFGFGGRQVVEVTASTDVNVMPPRSRRNGSGGRRSAGNGAGANGGHRAAAARGGGTLLDRVYGGGETAAPVGGRATAAAAPGPDPGRPSITPAAEGRAASTALPGRDDETLPPDGAQPSPLSAGAPAPAQQPTGGEPSHGSELDEEVRQIRSMVHRMMRQQAGKPRDDLPDELFNQYLALLEQEVTEELAEEVIERVKGKLSTDQVGEADAVREAIGDEIAELIPEDAQPWQAEGPSDGRPLTIALIGPTGVGKTTTLAKLAATFKLRQKKRVALVTIDTYRIAAVDQLRTYANIIDLPLHVVLTSEELREVMDRCSGYDVVLIDTAGRSQRDDEKLEHLRQAMEVANPHEIHLVLASTCSQRVLMEAVERFSKIRLDRVIFTKLDEAVNFGVLLNVARRVNKRLSYLTTGQDVPHQIEPGRSSRLAKLIMGEGV